MSESIDNLIPILESANTHQLAEWWSELNRWGWPAELGEPERVPTAHHERSPRRSAVMDWITSRLDPKFINRVWNKEMTDTEHEEWWLTKTIPESVTQREIAKRS